jgi:hypothetical protein
LNRLKQNKWLYLGAIALLIYSLLEIVDCLVLFLISLGVVPNFSANMYFVYPEIKQLFVSQPTYLITMVLSFTLMRIISTIGLFKNRLWGFWLGILSLTITMIWTILIIPIGFFELLGCVCISIFLIIGFFGDSLLLNDIEDFKK